MKETTEYRMVCQRFGTQGHSGHKWMKKSEEATVQSVIDSNLHSETHPTPFHVKEAPYRRQSRIVTKWEDNDEPL